MGKLAPSVWWCCLLYAFTATIIQSLRVRREHMHLYMCTHTHTHTHTFNSSNCKNFFTLIFVEFDLRSSQITFFFSDILTWSFFPLSKTVQSKFDRLRLFRKSIEHDFCFFLTIFFNCHLPAYIFCLCFYSLWWRNAKKKRNWWKKLFRWDFLRNVGDVI